MGGDGSLGLLISILSKDPVINANLGSLIFVPLPYGTGNDLSRSMGWGGTEGKWASSLESLVTAIIFSNEDKLALWNLDIFSEVSTFSNGKFVVVTDEYKRY
jgi:hypothetical protein